MMGFAALNPSYSAADSKEIPGSRPSGRAPE